MDLGAIILIFIVHFEVDVYIDVDVDIQGARGRWECGAERYLARKSRQLAKSKVGKWSRKKIQNPLTSMKLFWDFLIETMSSFWNPPGNPIKCNA